MTQKEEFAFNFKVGQEAKADSEDEYLSGEDDGLDYDDEADFSLTSKDNQAASIWPSYDARLLMPAEEVRTTRRDLEAVHEQEEIEVAPGLFLLKGRVSNAEAADLLKNRQVSSSDLIPTVYEGGFKLWEGAIDLIHYMLERYEMNGQELTASEMVESPLQGKTVLELGCGHGLPGIVALMAGAEVHFQDFNREVLTRLTIPNVLSNMGRLPQGRSRGAVRFFSGDWHSVGELLTSKGFGGHYDLILTSESIYSVESQRRMIECVKQVLQPPLGVVLVAAKSFYFGVGGGIKTFKQAVKHDGIFEVQHVYRTTRDVSAAMRPVTAAHKQEAISAEVAEAVEPAASQDAAVTEAAVGMDTATTDVDASVAQPHIDEVQEKQPEEEEEEEAEGGSKPAASGAVGGDGASTGDDAGGNFREVLQLTFPAAILPYFL